MDYSDIYIQMCGQADEIQKIVKQRPTEFSDIFYNKQSDEFHFGAFCDEEDIWLPMQDTLQNMLDTSISYCLVYTGGFYKIVLCSADKTFSFNADSPEICFISTVMKTSFNKVWSNQEWIYS